MYITYIYIYHYIDHYIDHYILLYIIYKLISDINNCLSLGQCCSLWISKQPRLFAFHPISSLPARLFASHPPAGTAMRRPFEAQLPFGRLLATVSPDVCWDWKGKQPFQTSMVTVEIPFSLGVWKWRWLSATHADPKNSVLHSLWPTQRWLW